MLVTLLAEMFPYFDSLKTNVVELYINCRSYIKEHTHTHTHTHFASFRKTDHLILFMEIRASGVRIMRCA